MPAQHLRQPTDAKRFSVIGEYASLSNSIRHVGMLAQPMTLSLGVRVGVYEAGPPLKAGQEPLKTGVGTMPAAVVGWIEDLQAGEVERMEAWLESIRPLIVNDLLGNYAIHPASVELRDKITHRRIGIKFSCVGLIERCYADGASIQLLTDPTTFPEATREFLLETWQASPIRLPRLGIVGPGPWRVLLPGYLLHALRREKPRENPYTPRLEDASFG